jgi:hypothetical protein
MRFEGLSRILVLPQPTYFECLSRSPAVHSKNSICAIASGRVHITPCASSKTKDAALFQVAVASAEREARSVVQEELAKFWEEILTLLRN